jgi:predicted ATPase
MSIASKSSFSAADAASAQWRVRLLGGFEIDNGQERLTRLRSRAATLLVARLALAPTRDHAREELCELLWPEVSLALSRSRLRQTLSMLRAVLEPPGSEPVLLVDKRVLRVMPGALWCDAVAFERAVARGDSAVALGHYGGELLPGFYDEWVHDERLRLEGLRDRLSGAAVGASAPPPAAPQAPMPPSSVAKPAQRLPSYWTRAFGLQPSVDDLAALVAAERLVTVHGPGGSGKTRLAVATAQAFSDQVQADANQRFTRIEFVPLLACTTTAQALDAMGQVLRVEGTGDALRRLTAALDNAEQLVADDLGSAITRLLSGLPELHVLVTSRRLLDVDGETSFALEGLPLPSAEVNGGDNAALALFVARARAVRVDFHINAAHHAQAAAALVRLLSGMPLAIELAASRMRSLSAPELLERLQAGAGSPMLNLLARGTQRATPDARHASMRHTIAWTWEQLTSPQRQLLQALAIPAMPVRLEAVAALAGVAVLATQLQLDELVAASMVYVVEGTDACRRFALLQPVREFAAETSSAADSFAARQRLRAWLQGFAREAMVRGPTFIAPDIGLVELAIVTAMTDSAQGEAWKLALTVRQFWNVNLPSAQAVSVLEEALAAHTAHPSSSNVVTPDGEVQAYELLAFVRLMNGDPNAALAHADMAISLPADDASRAQALARWSWVRYGSGDFECDYDLHLNEAELLAKRSGDLRTMGRVLFMQSVVACDLRLQFELAEVLVAKRHAIWMNLGDHAGVTGAVLNRAILMAHLGRHQEAVASAVECVAGYRASNNLTGYAFASMQLARIHMMARQWSAACTAFNQSVETGWAQHLSHYLARAMLHMPNAIAMGDKPALAARLHGFATAHHRRHYALPNRIEARELCRTRRLLRIRLGAAQFEARMAEGAALTTAQAVALALAQGPKPN